MSESFYSSDIPMGVSCPSHPHPLPALTGLSPRSIPRSCSILWSHCPQHLPAPHPRRTPCPMAWHSWEMQGSKPGKCSKMDGENQWDGDLDLMHGHWEMQKNCCGSPKYRFLSVQDSEHCTSACFCLALGWSGLGCFAYIMQPPNSPTVFRVQNMDQAGFGQGCASPCSRGSPMPGCVPATHCSRLCLGARCSNRYRVNHSCAGAFPRQ